MEEWYDSSKRTASCVTMSAFRNALRRSLLPSKRHTAIFCYNSPSWRQPQQLRQRLIPLRRIQSSCESARSARMASGATIAGPAAAPASASTANSATSAEHVGAPTTVSTASSATDAENVAALACASTASKSTHAGLVVVPAFVSMGRDAVTAGPAAVLASASTTGGALNALSARTSHAPWKAAHSSATVSAQPERF